MPKQHRKAPRKVVQFSATADARGAHVLYALAADGSLWFMRMHDEHYMPWQKIDPLPRAKVRS